MDIGTTKLDIHSQIGMTFLLLISSARSIACCCLQARATRVSYAFNTAASCMLSIYHQAWDKIDDISCCEQSVQQKYVSNTTEASNFTSAFYMSRLMIFSAESELSGIFSSIIKLSHICAICRAQFLIQFIATRFA